MTDSTARISPLRTARISPDRPIVGYAVIVLIALIMLASYIYSFFAISAAAAWTDIPENAKWIRFTAPMFIDGAIITYTTAFAVHRWRREVKHARYSRRILYFMTVVSVLINAAHAASYWRWDFAQYESLAGLLIAVMAPIAALFSAESLIKMVFEQDAGEKTQALPDSSLSGIRQTSIDDDAQERPLALSSERLEPQDAEQEDSAELAVPENALVAHDESDVADEALLAPSTVQIEEPEGSPSHHHPVENSSTWHHEIHDVQTSETQGLPLLPIDERGFYMIPGQVA